MFNRFQKAFMLCGLGILLGQFGVASPPKSVPIGNIKGGNGGNKIPVYVPFSCEYTDVGIILYSSRSIVGEIEVINDEGEIVGEGCGNFNPELFIPVDDFSGHLTITIYIADWDMTYVGYIE